MTLVGIIFGYLQRYKTKALFESFCEINVLNYQHLLITQKCLKSIKNGLKIDLLLFFTSLKIRK